MLVRRAIDGQSLLVRVGAAAAGANVLFVGTTRNLTDGVATSRLDYAAHEPMAEAKLGDLRAEAIGRYGLLGCEIEHRLGVVPVGEASVAIAVSAPHRRAAFAAAEWLMEQIKAEVPIWKCEEGPDGGRAWVHPDAAPGRSA